MDFLKIISFILIAITGVLTIFQFLKRVEWWIRLADFIHLQLTVVSFCSWLFLLIFYFNETVSRYFIIFGVALSVIHLYIILPYTRLYKKQVKDSKNKDVHNQISILEANVLMYNESYDKLLNLVENMHPDILIAIETDYNWESAIEVLSEKYPYQIRYAQDNTYGMHLYSKLELREDRVHFYVEEDVPAFRTKVKLRNESLVNLFVIHPRPPSPSENYRSLERDAELLIVGREVAEIDEPVIVAGDLNDVAWSHTSRLFQRLSGLLDPRIGRGVFNTFHVKYPLIRWPLDHVFHSKHFLVGNVQRLKSIDSDHFPIFLKLHLEAHLAKKVNEGTEQLSTKDVHEAENKLKRVDT